MPNALLNYKSKQFWFLLLFLVYSLLGWLLVPYVVKQQAIIALKDLAAWETKIDSVVFNPYALSLAVQGVDIQDQNNKQVISFERLFINFSALKSLTGQIAFDEISLIEPIVNVDLNAEGKTNFQRAFENSDSEAAPVKEEESSEEAQILALFFDLISISNGKVHFVDNTREESYEITLSPLNLALHKFASHDNEGGDYRLDLALGHGQTLSWKGRIGIAPFTSQGQLALSNIRSGTFWHYAKEHSPYWLNNADISLKGDYDTEFSEHVSRLVINNAAIDINKIQLAESKEHENLLSLKHIGLSPITFNLEQNTASLGTLTIDTPELSVLKDQDASINLLRPLTNMQAASSASVENDEALTNNPEQNTEPTTQTQQKSFKWNITGIRLLDGSINWQDQSIRSPANISLSHLDIDLGAISHNLDAYFPYKIGFQTGEKTQTLTGRVTAAPFNIEGDLKLDAIPLTLLQPYIDHAVNAELSSGHLNVSSQFQLAHDTKVLSGALNTDISIDDIHLKDQALQEPLAGFERFAISNVELSLPKNAASSLSIADVQLTKPYSHVNISPTGEVNLSTLSRTKDETTEAEPVAQESPVTSDSQQEYTDSQVKPQILIEKITISEGRFDFVDASQSPVFNTYLDQISGTVTKLSSDVEAHSKVDISGNLETYGKLAIQGTLNPLSPTPNSQLDIQVSNIDLSTASPYSAKYAGYLIDKGKLDLDLSYGFTDTKLEANNHIFINQFAFGDSVDSPDATSLPLPLAVGIMKNLKGEIDIDLPISGDLADPSFSIGSVLFTAFSNLITKVVTSPFAILGALVEGGDDISSLHFLANTSTLSPEEQSKALKLADALLKRPNLNLEIRGHANANFDHPPGQVATDANLTRLAKERVRNISQALIEQGKVPESRIFTLDPKITKLNSDDSASNNTDQEKAPSYVPTFFTISVK